MASRLLIALAGFQAACGLPTCGAASPPQSPEQQIATFSDALYSAEQITRQRLERAKGADDRGIVLELKGGSDREKHREQAAARRILDAGFALSYWIEVGRQPALARAHPEWMASIQGHQQWRRLFPNAPRPGKGEVVKAFPWVPVLYREAFDAHLTRIEELLRGLPPAATVYLNDLQGPPSACGCGNPLCRWTSDYGPVKTATPLGDDAAARFVRAVQNLSRNSQVVPVWVTECEEHDGAKTGWCAGVGCFRGICWKAWTRQLTPLAKTSDRLAVLVTYRELRRDLPVYRQEAAWVRHAIASFQTMPARHGGKAVPASRLVAVIQAWDVDEDQVRAQRQQARKSGAAGVIVSYTPIDQSWKPQLLKYRSMQSPKKRSGPAGSDGAR